MSDWGWVWRYGAAIVATLWLGAHLGDLPMFSGTSLGDANQPASKLAKFAGHVVALLLFWMLGQRAAAEIPDDGKGFSFLRRIIPPTTLLVVILAGRRVMRPLAGPFLAEMDKGLYNSIFLFGIIGSALWLALTWVRNSALLAKPVEKAAPRPEPDPFEHDAPPKRKPREEPEHTMPLPASPRNQPQPRDRREENREKTVRVESPGPGRTLGRYAVVKELGRGAMGVVYLGKDPTIQRFVALKTVPFDMDEPGELAEAKRRFFREAESAGRLSHPNIVTIYDAGEEGSLGYIAMEVLEGITLKDWCRKETLQPVKRVLKVVATVAEALDHAHSLGVVHRDIKPGNIMITKGDIVKLTDFGIARITTSTKTQTNVILGTPSYMSPEQVAGEKVDGRSDLFSLGVVLYELLTGERPFQGESIASLLFQIANKPHRAPAQIRTDLPPCCAAIIDRALCKEIDQRYQSGLELAADLSVCLQALSD